MNKIALWTVLLLLSATLAQARVPDFADLVARNSPAVVKINTVKSGSGAQFELPPGEEIPDILRDLFENRDLPRRNPHAMGSGFITSADGYIVTNHHVIDGADEIRVRLMDRREFSARLVGTDPRSDLALLKVEARDLPVVTFADPEGIRVGEWVVAIGSPFGLDYSASVGIVSAIGRSLPSAAGENYVPFIQSDVAINPGNSGGPLFNQSGEVVGINSQIYTRTGGSVGVSFAIPVTVALDVLAQLKDKGAVERGWLGVYIQDVDQSLAQSLGLDRPAGALVSQVMAEGPAAAAGFVAGDVIVSFNGSAIGDSGDLPHVVGQATPGSKVEAVIVRDGRKKTLTVTVGKLPDNPLMADPEPPRLQEDQLGLSVQPLEPETADRLGVAGGVVVERVNSGSPADYAELKPGDVIVQLGGAEITGRSSYRAAVKALPKGVPVLIRFLRQGQFIYRTVELSP